MTRRECFQSLFGYSAASEWPQRRNARKHHRADVLYSGSMEIPESVIAHALQSPLYRTTHRHEVVRFKLHGITWLFREIASAVRYAGEVVRTDAGTLRVHLFRVLPPSRDRVRASISEYGEITRLDQSTGTTADTR